MSMVLLTVNVKFRNNFKYSKGPIKGPGEVCGDFQALKSPGQLTCQSKNVPQFAQSNASSRFDSVLA